MPVFLSAYVALMKKTLKESKVLDTSQSKGARVVSRATKLSCGGIEIFAGLSGFSRSSGLASCSFGIVRNKSTS